MRLSSRLGRFSVLVGSWRHRRYEEGPGFPGPYGLPFVQALLKTPMGALTGLLGRRGSRNNLLGVLGPQTEIRVFAYIALFGYAQEVLRISSTGGRGSDCQVQA